MWRAKGSTACEPYLDLDVKKQHDITDYGPNEYDQMNTLLSNSKHWLFYRRGSRILDRLLKEGGHVTDLLGWLKSEKYAGARILHCEQRAGDTVFFPWGWGHAVVTVEEKLVSLLCIYLADEDEERRESTRRMRVKELAPHCPVGQRTSRALKLFD